MIDIQKGQYFKSSDNERHIFLGYKNPNIIYCLDDNFEETGEISLYDVDFISSPLNEFNNNAKKINWYFQCKEELENANLETKLNYLTTNMANDFQDWEKQLAFIKLDIRIKKVSDLVKAKAYYYNQNQYYEVIGFLVETETYERNKKIEDNIGLFSIYHSKCDELAPMTFFYKDENKDTRFYNKDTFDCCTVEEVLMSENDIQKYISEHKIDIPRLENNQDNKAIGK